MEVERARTDNIFRMLRLHRSSIQTLQREVIRAYYGQVERDSFYEKMLQDIVSLIFQVSEVDGLYKAIQILNTGHLPHQIINHKQFNPFPADPEITRPVVSVLQTLAPS